MKHTVEDVMAWTDLVASDKFDLPECAEMLRAYAALLARMGEQVATVNHVVSGELDLPIGLLLFAAPVPSDAAVEAAEQWRELYDKGVQISGMKIYEATIDVQTMAREILRLAGE